jgi:hypothetical protein
MIDRRYVLGIYISALVLASSASAAEGVGIAACDDLLKRYESCLAAYTPPGEWSSFKRDLDKQVRDYAVFLARDIKAKAKVRAACERHRETTRDLGGNTDCHVSPFLVFQSPFLFQERKPH